VCEGKIAFFNSVNLNRLASYNNGENAFGDAFGDVELAMTPHQAQRDQELKEQTDKEVEDG
jgi:hypothetical protein